MARTHEAYPPEFRWQPVELVNSGRTPSELAREYEPAADSIRNWVVQSARDAGERSDRLSTDELLELRRLRRESKQLRTECEVPPRSRLGRAARRLRCGIRMRVRQQLSPTSGRPPMGILE